eukprot:6213320-Pleurochrysis_carterae.AAC.8
MHAKYGSSVGKTLLTPLATSIRRVLQAEEDARRADYRADDADKHNVALRMAVAAVELIELFDERADGNGQLDTFACSTSSRTSSLAKLQGKCAIP